MEQNEVIGRRAEKVLFNDIFSSNQSEFVAIYGRRRVGKTFLVRETFSGRFSFEIAGLANATTKEQLVNFSLTLKKTTGEELKTPKSWLEAFSQLSDYLAKSEQKRKILFFDEMPWMDTPRSGFLTALEHFWNGWACSRSDITTYYGNKTSVRDFGHTVGCISVEK